MTRPIIFALPALSLLAACVTPNEPTVSASDVDRAFAEAQAISTRPLTDPIDLPFGGVTYQGHLGADVSGDANGSILGDMTMSVDFLDNEVGGRITNINLIDPDGTPNQRFDGTLKIDGVETRGQLDAFASGTITGVDNDNMEVDSQMLLTLDGDVYDNLGRGDAVFGSAEGQARGEFNMDVDGVFFGTAN
ncbi:MAG: hypothetical protein AAFU41_14260 [Pseudomonadota bacterium]